MPTGNCACLSSTFIVRWSLRVLVHRSVQSTMYWVYVRNLLSHTMHLPRTENLPSPHDVRRYRAVPSRRTRPVLLFDSTHPHMHAYEKLVVA